MIIVTGGQIVQAATRLNLEVMLVGSDGQGWDLRSGPVRLTPGVQGIGPADPEHWWRDSPTLDGSLHLGQRTPRFQVILPVKITSATSADWVATNGDFMRSIDPRSGDGTCSLRVTAPGMTQRKIDVRLTGGMSPPFEIDPVYRQHAQFTLEFDAEYPYWTEPQGAFYHWDGPSQIPTSIALGKPITNPGDAPVDWRSVGYGPWAVFWVGPDQDHVWRLASSLVTAGNGRVVNTDPRFEGIAVTALDGADRWADVQSRTPGGQIQPGDSNFRILATGTTSVSSITLEFTPAYRMPW